MLCLGIVPVLGALYLARGRMRSLDQMRERIEGDCRCRLECVATALAGKLIDGPALQTAAGVISLRASRAPQSMVIDQTVFAAPAAGGHVLSIVGKPDSACAIRSRFIRPVPSLDPDLLAGYLVTSSDEGFARTVVTRPLLDALRSLDTRIRGRTQLRVTGGAIAIVVNRGLSTPGELLAFHEGCGEVVRLLRPVERD